MILDEIKEAYVKDLLAKGKRADGRGLLDYRQVKITKGIIPNAEGSAMAELGDTKVLCGVKFDVMKPYADRPTEGVFTVQAEFLPLAHPEFEAGPPKEGSIELARVVDRGIRSAEALDVKDWLLEEEKVLGAFLDIYILDHCGNLIDAASLAAMAALLDAKVPKYEEGKLVRGEFKGPLPLARKVASCSFEKIGASTVLDATDEEEVASDGRLTLATSDGDFLVCAQKSGAAGFSEKEIMDLMDISLEKGRALRSLV
ncbi:MAG: RNA-binding protein [Candidatus Micrarchaeota archaeon]